MMLDPMNTRMYSHQYPTKLNTQQDLLDITQLVNSLFASSSPGLLAEGVTDYWIDQVMLKVDALSDEMFANEKQSLQHLVKQAKQYSNARNLLVGGSFQDITKWTLSRNTRIQSNDALVRGNYLLLPPATSGPSYAYQKIEASKLKPYTRYYVSGFIMQGDPLEIMVSYSDQEVNKIVHVPAAGALPLSSNNKENCCQPLPNTSYMAKEQIDPHFFTYSIDIGELPNEQNLGIQFGLKISSPTGLATISNLEIIEGPPLTDKETDKVEHQDNKWAQKQQIQQSVASHQILQAIDQMNALYQSENWQGKISDSMTAYDVSSVVLPDVPNQVHWFMTDRPGETYQIMQALLQAQQSAWKQIQLRNLIKNGLFLMGLTDWNVSSDVTLRKGSAGYILDLPSWESTASTTVTIPSQTNNTDLLFHVCAKGEGRITLTSGNSRVPIDINTTDFIDISQYFFPGSQTVMITIEPKEGLFSLKSIELLDVTGHSI